MNCSEVMIRNNLWYNIWMIFSKFPKNVSKVLVLAHVSVKENDVTEDLRISTNSLK
jgi:hypothetical protein